MYNDLQGPKSLLFIFLASLSFSVPLPPHYLVNLLGILPSRGLCTRYAIQVPQGYQGLLSHFLQALIQV